MTQDDFDRLVHDLRTQDNAATAYPLYTAWGATGRLSLPMPDGTYDVSGCDLPSGRRMALVVPSGLETDDLRHAITELEGLTRTLAGLLGN